MKEKLLRSSVIHADETVVQVLREPNRKAQTDSRMWVYCAGKYEKHSNILFEYSPTRNGENARNFLGAYSGYVVCDGYDGYNKLTGPVEINIDATYKQDGTLESWTVNTNGQNIVTIENNKGALLPGTGGMGTVLFTLAGAALIGYGVYRKRAAQNVA